LTNNNLTDYGLRSRQQRLRIRFSGIHADAILVSHLPDIRYLCGFSGSNALLIVSCGESTLITDSRYTIQASEETSGVDLLIASKPLFAEAGGLLSQSRARKAVFYSPGRVTVAQFAVLRKAAGTRVRMRRDPGLISGLRGVKDPNEIQAMKEAADLVSAVFADVIPLIRPGVLENELAAEIEYCMRRRGASGASFETIVASGARSALPHARPSDKPISKNELVVLDLGAILRGYCSDMTRTVFVGRAPRRVREWYGAVLNAQEAAIRALKPGVSAGDVDSAARRVLQRHRLARFFTHSTGHGLGIEVHEAPRLGRGETTKLVAGNVVTIEPGIYVENVGGIRIEDDVLVVEDDGVTAEKRAQILTSAPKEFLEL
jgi:Xaa-Pro aminopeptidase